MKILIVYESFHHGNTERIARAMAEAAGARLAHVKEVSKDDVAAADIVGFGSGIYFWQHHHRLLKLADELSLQKGKNAFLFSTAGLRLPLLMHHVMRKKLRKKGFRIVGEFACRGLDTFGPLSLIGGIARKKPDEHDLRKAQQFIMQLTTRH